MEVLGAISSSLAVLDGAAVGIRKTVQTLERLKKAPTELSNLLDEVHLLLLVTEVISDTNQLANVPKGLDSLLGRLRRQLLELEQLIHFKLVKADIDLEVDPIAWTRYWNQTSKHLRDISKTMEYISITLSASTFLHTVQASSDLKALSHMAGNAKDSQVSSMTDISNRLDNLTMLCNQIFTSASSANKAERLLEPLCQAATRAYELDKSVQDEHVPQTQQANTPSTDRLAKNVFLDASIPIDPSRQAWEQCLKSCRCRCHSRKSFNLPSSLRHWIGSLRITMNNSNLTRAPCNVKRCRRTGDTKSTLQYTFPAWLSQVIVSARYNRAFAGSVERVLRLVQTAPRDAIWYAEEGMLGDLRCLYTEGRASIHDVDPEGGDSLVAHAFMYGQTEVVRFLLQNGADLTQQNYAGFETRDILFEQFYGPWQRIHGTRELCAFVDVTEIEEGLEFTLLHRIVLGRSSRDLATELEEFPELVDIPDVHGRTPLFWAVWREDLAAVTTLLEYGADPGIAANDGSTVFHVIAWSSYGEDLFALISDSFARRKSTKVPSSLLSTEEYYGSSPWHNAIRFNQPGLLKAFLEHNPNLTAKSANGQSLFQYAIIHASAVILSILTTADLNEDGFEAVTRSGRSVMDDVIARLEFHGLPDEWDSSSGIPVALIRFVARARKFLPQLPRLLYGSKLGAVSEPFVFSLSDSTVGSTDDEIWALKADLEDCLTADGGFILPWDLKYDYTEDNTMIDNDDIEDEERFFDANE